MLTRNSAGPAQPGAGLRARLESVRGRIVAAAHRAGRDPGEVTLVAVTKTVAAASVRELAALGQVDVGENRVQEMLVKQDLLADLPLRWHMIGHLQTNKVKYVLNRYMLLHTLDRLSLAQELQKRLKPVENSAVRCLVQVNTRQDPSRQGVEPEDLMGFLAEVSPLDRVRVVGLMTMAPPVGDPEEARPYFRRLRELAAAVADQCLPNISMRHLSMGMTGDFEVAVEEGATLVRVGSALFGAHPV